eukprot:CAMPEP_0177585380 /NCGR_PEP_ID=MMETSP0419_2-20121207/4459_1 /TAXON_ID=582737 /ORGANISM="Tetraselmis sp., Strain GSL018" /LENGTH=103 /DNA_ID=CAMNT_0019075103 /DNA_START=360 /DNA_END=671 /DNA_ORIENTATION=+
MEGLRDGGKWQKGGAQDRRSCRQPLQGLRLWAHRRHRVGLVQDQQLEGRAGVPGCRRADRLGGKALDLVPDDADAPLVAGVQLHDAGLEQLRPKELMGYGEGS